VSHDSSCAGMHDQASSEWITDSDAMMVHTKAAWGRIYEVYPFRLGFGRPNHNLVHGRDILFPQPPWPMSHNVHAWYMIIRVQKYLYYLMLPATPQIGMHKGCRMAQAGLVSYQTDMIDNHACLKRSRHVGSLARYTGFESQPERIVYYGRGHAEGDRSSIVF
jgi:hypothetical protein